MEQLQWTEAKIEEVVVAPTFPSQPPHPPTLEAQMLESQVQPTQFDSLQDDDNRSTDSDIPEVSFKYPLAFRELIKRVDKLSGKSDENHFEVWLIGITEATTDCIWTDVDGFLGSWQALQR